jgi:hypothetical protein
MYDNNALPFAETNTQIENSCNLFSPISLAEIDKKDKVKLLDRFDKKYIFRSEMIGTLLDQVSCFYRILEINNHRVFQYITQYYDTPQFEMYLNHHNRKLNRFKVRKREYSTTGKSFFEIKFKSNKGKTQKTRIEVENRSEILDKDQKKFLKENSAYSAKMLDIKLLNQFNRITLVHKCDHERVTIDFNLGFQLDSSAISLPFLAVAEIKREKRSGSSDLALILKKEDVRPMKFSKYCLGTAMLNPEIKSNRFKSKLLTINKLENDSVYSTTII